MHVRITNLTLFLRFQAANPVTFEKCFERELLERKKAGVTTNLRLVGGEGVIFGRPRISDPPGLHSYGSEQSLVTKLPGARRQLGGGLTEAMVRFAARHEYARTAEDVLARRWRLLFLDARLAGSLAAGVGAILQEETGVDPQVAALERLARLYLTLPA